MNCGRLPQVTQQGTDGLDNRHFRKQLEVADQNQVVANAQSAVDTATTALANAETELTNARNAVSRNPNDATAAANLQTAQTNQQTATRNLNTARENLTREQEKQTQLNDELELLRGQLDIQNGINSAAAERYRKCKADQDEANSPEGQRRRAQEEADRLEEQAREQRRVASEREQEAQRIRNEQRTRDAAEAQELLRKLSHGETEGLDMSPENLRRLGLPEDLHYGDPRIARLQEGYRALDTARDLQGRIDASTDGDLTSDLMHQQAEALRTARTNGVGENVIPTGFSGDDATAQPLRPLARGPAEPSAATPPNNPSGRLSDYRGSQVGTYSSSTDPAMVFRGIDRIPANDVQGSIAFRDSVTGDLFRARNGDAYLNATPAQRAQMFQQGQLDIYRNGQWVNVTATADGHGGWRLSAVGNGNVVTQFNQANFGWSRTAGSSGGLYSVSSAGVVTRYSPGIGTPIATRHIGGGQIVTEGQLTAAPARLIRASGGMCLVFPQGGSICY